MNAVGVHAVAVAHLHDQHGGRVDPESHRVVASLAAFDAVLLIEGEDRDRVRSRVSDGQAEMLDDEVEAEVEQAAPVDRRTPDAMAPALDGMEDVWHPGR